MSAAPAPVDRRAPCPCGSGRKYKSCCYPKDRARADVAAAAVEGQRRIDEVNRVLLPLVESRGEHRIACGRGCGGCCSNYIRTSDGQAQAIAGFLLEPAQAATLGRFEARLPEWRARAAALGAILDELLARHGDTPAGGDDLARYSEAYLAYQRVDVPCPALDESGACGVYPVRPLPCRAINVVDTAEFCRPDRGRGPSVVQHPLLGDAIREARALIAAAETRALGGTRERSLPIAVSEALAARRATSP